LIHHDFDLGRYAISVFFLVSGFLIPSTLRKSGTTLRKFIIHRVFRLYPAYWFSIAVFVLVNWLVYGVSGTSTSAVLVNLTMLQSFVGIPDVIGAFWTLQIELIFYVLCGFLFVIGLLERRRFALTVSLLAMVGLSGLRFKLARNLPVAIPLALSLMVLGDMIRAHNQGEFSSRAVTFWSIAVALALVPTCFWAYKDFGRGAMLSNWAAIATFIVCYTLREQLARPGLIRRSGTFFGDIS
jgi:peptidoglycan/LPS O-acetylase OafA/YrhL